MIVSPSVLSMDYSRMSEQTVELNDSGAKWIHFDVMDGHFVPNLTFGPDILKGFRKMSDLLLDVHVMITDPIKFAPVFLDAGADIYTFHLEALSDYEKISELAMMIHSRGKRMGISIKPGTSVNTLKPFMNIADLFLLMSVEPGFGGQSFIPATKDRITELRKIIADSHSEALIEVDGGINEQTSRIVKEAGCDVVVAGSYVFKNDIRKAVTSLE